MANKDNQSKQYRIYIKESKSWVDVNKEFDNTVSDGEGNEKSWLDDMPDESAAIAELMEDAELLRALYAKLNELDPEGRLICQLIMEGKSERDCGKEMGLSRNTFVYRRDKLFQKLRSELKDYI